MSSLFISHILSLPRAISCSIDISFFLSTPLSLSLSLSQTTQLLCLSVFNRCSLFALSFSPVREFMPEKYVIIYYLSSISLSLFLSLVLTDTETRHLKTTYM